VVVCYCLEQLLLQHAEACTKDRSDHITLYVEESEKKFLVSDTDHPHNVINYFLSEGPLFKKLMKIHPQIFE